MKQLRINERIRVSEVRVIGDDGSQLGIMTPQEALRIARERGFDLVEVAPMSSPPVCRVMDFNKYRYEEQRRDREAKKKHHSIRLKEIKFRPHIESHDYGVKKGQIQRFLLRGDQVKVTMVYRGREMAHTDVGRRVLDRLAEDLKSISKVERVPALDGRMMTMVFGPDRQKIKQAIKQAEKKAAAAKANTPTDGAPAPASAAKQQKAN